jgi:hypothetical protein
MRFFFAIALVACKSHKEATPPVNAAELIEQMRGFADRVCACDRIACVRPIRDELDAVKKQLLAGGARLSADDKARFDAELHRLRGCGDGAGLTIWIEE